MKIEGRSLPDFLIIGAAKSGTTSLFYYLEQHPSIFLPIAFKEPGYLCFSNRQPLGYNPAAPYPDMWRAVINDLTAYSDLFRGSRPDQLLGEATPEYLYLYDTTIKTIRNTYRNSADQLKSIAILRNPISRIWSHYWMFRRDGYESLSFAEAVAPETIQSRLHQGWHPSYDYRGFGNYSDQISAWQRAFGKDRLKIVLLDDLQKHPRQVCIDIFRFLEVQESAIIDASTTYNVSGSLKRDWLHEYLFRRQYALKTLVRHALPSSQLQRIKQYLLKWNTQKVPMPDAVKAELLQFYRNDILALQELMARDLSGWLR